MLPRNAARRHTPLPGAQGCSNRVELIGVYLTRMVVLDVAFVRTTRMAGRNQGAHKEAGKSLMNREATKKTPHAKVGTSGYTYATLAHETHGRLGDEAREQMQRSPFVGSQDERRTLFSYEFFSLLCPAWCWVRFATARPLSQVPVGGTGFPEWQVFQLRAHLFCCLLSFLRLGGGHVSGVSLGAVCCVWRCQLWSCRVMEVLHVV